MGKKPERGIKPHRGERKRQTAFKEPDEKSA
jgi:hypothetical protein